MLQCWGHTFPASLMNLAHFSDVGGWVGGSAGGGQGPKRPPPRGGGGG